LRHVVVVEVEAAPRQSRRRGEGVQLVERGVAHHMGPEGAVCWPDRLVDQHGHDQKSRLGHTSETGATPCHALMVCLNGAESCPQWLRPPPSLRSRSRPRSSCLLPISARPFCRGPATSPTCLARSCRPSFCW